MLGLKSIETTKSTWPYCLRYDYNKNANSIEPVRLFIETVNLQLCEPTRNVVGNTANCAKQ